MEGTGLSKSPSLLSWSARASSRQKSPGEDPLSRVLLQIAGTLISPSDSATGETASALQSLTTSIQFGKNFSEAFSDLDPQAQNLIRQKIGLSTSDELLSLAKEKDPEMFWEYVLHFGSRLEQEGKLEEAASIYQLVGATPGGRPTDVVKKDDSAISFVAESVQTGGHMGPPLQVGVKAQERLDAIVGRGSFGSRFEFLAARFSHSVADYRTILPMMGASFLGQVVGTAALGRFAASTSEAWYTRGVAARFLAGTAAYFAEVPTFALLNRGFSGGEGKFTDELARSALSLGALKVCGFLSNQAFLKIHGLNELGIPTRLNALTQFSQAAFPQAAMFTGLLASHKLEETLGLRAPTDGATTVTDTLASMLSLGIGSHLGHSVLGSGFARFQREMGLRAQVFTEFGNPKSGGNRFASFGNLAPAFAGNYPSAASRWKTSISDPAKNPHLSLMENKGDGGGGKPNVSGLPKDTTASERFAKARRMTVQEVIALVKKGNEDAAELFVEMVSQKFAPGWILYEAAQSGDPAARESIRDLPLDGFEEKAKSNSEIRDLLYVLGKAEHPTALRILFKAAVAEILSQPWAVIQMHYLANEEYPGAKEILQNLDVSGLAKQSSPHSEWYLAMRFLAQEGNGNALMTLAKVAETDSQAKPHLKEIFKQDPEACYELLQRFPELKALKELLLKEGDPATVEAALQKALEPHHASAPNPGGGTTVAEASFKVLPRGGVIVKTSKGWLQFGVPPWTNKDAFDLYASQGGFAQGDKAVPKEKVPHLISTTYFFDPHYVAESHGLLPADFIQYMYFIAKGTTFNLIAPDAETASRLKTFLNLSYQGPNDAAALTERVKREYLSGAVGIPDLGREIREGFGDIAPDNLRKIGHLDEAASYAQGGVLVKKIAPLLYEIFDEGKSLGQVDLREHPIPKATLESSLPLLSEPKIQALREKFLIERRPGLWWLGTGHGFTSKEETSGFMLWNQGRLVLVDPPSITLEYLIRYGIPLSAVDGIFITHGHTDHHGTAIPTLLRVLPKVKIYTTPTIGDMLQKQYEAAVGNHGEGLRQWNFVPIYPQQFTKINGMDFWADYGFHSVPTIGFTIYDRPDIQRGKVVFHFTGDTFADHAELWAHTQPKSDQNLEKLLGSINAGLFSGSGRWREIFQKHPTGMMSLFLKYPELQGLADTDKLVEWIQSALQKKSPPLLSRQRALNILRHISLLMSSKGQTPPPTMAIEGGIAPIHIVPDKTREILDEAERQGVDTSRVLIYHVAQDAADKAKVPKWQAGPEGARDWSDYFDDFRPSRLEDYVLRVLEELPLLRSLPRKAKQTLAQHGRLERVPAGTTLMEEGKNGNSVYVLIDGETEIKVGNQRIGLRPSGLLGEGALLGESRNATVTTTVPSLMLELDAKAMGRLIAPTGLAKELENIRTIRAHAYQSVLKSPLGHLPDSTLDLLFKIGKLEYFRPQSHLIQEGENSRDVYLVLGGSVRVANRANTIHAVRSAGTMLGEMALVENTPRNATVTALEPTKVLRLPAKDLEKLMEEYPGLNIALNRTAEERSKSNGH